MEVGQYSASATASCCIPDCNILCTLASGGPDEAEHIRRVKCFLYKFVACFAHIFFSGAAIISYTATHCAVVVCGVKKANAHHVPSPLL